MQVPPSDCKSVFSVTLAHVVMFLRATTCYIAYMLRQFRLSVRPSYACINVFKQLNISSKCFHYLIGPPPIILVFRDQGFLRKSDGFTPNGGAEYKGSSDFRPICGYISETVTDRGIFTIEDVCAPSNSAALDDIQ